MNLIQPSNGNLYGTADRSFITAEITQLTANGVSPVIQYDLIIDNEIIGTYESQSYQSTEIDGTNTIYSFVVFPFLQALKSFNSISELTKLTGFRNVNSDWQKKLEVEFRDYIADSEGILVNNSTQKSSAFDVIAATKPISGINYSYKATNIAFIKVEQTVKNKNVNLWALWTKDINRLAIKAYNAAGGLLSASSDDYDFDFHEGLTIFNLSNSNLSLADNVAKITVQGIKFIRTESDENENGLVSYDETTETRTQEVAIKIYEINCDAQLITFVNGFGGVDEIEFRKNTNGIESESRTIETGEELRNYFTENEYRQSGFLIDDSSGNQLIKHLSLASYTSIENENCVIILEKIDLENNNYEFGCEVILTSKKEIAVW
jgi:hypothetical protein